MIDFSTLKKLMIPEGSVTKITDSSGLVLWMLPSDEEIKAVALRVKKFTSDTYAGETTYSNESFILLDIYPKASNSVIKVTYGGLTKTLSFNGTNAQQVFFGTFNGVTDSVSTPDSGTLTIEGDCNAFAISSFPQSSSSKGTTNAYCTCITGIDDWNEITNIPDYCCYTCTDLTEVIVSDKVTSMGQASFSDCSGLTKVVIGNSVTTIGQLAFSDCPKITSLTLGSSLATINTYCFYNSSTGAKRTIVCLGQTPPTLSGSSPLGRTDEIVSITVPKGCKAAYEAGSGWSQYKSYIVEAS